MNTAFNGSDNLDMGVYDDMMPDLGWQGSLQKSIETYLYPVIMFVGIVGNLTAMPALYVISLRTWSTIFYLCLLSCLDLVILLIKCGNAWYSKVALINLSEKIINTSDALCKTYMFAFNFLIHLSPWIMVVVAIEMTIATRWPQRIYIVCTIERASNVVILLVILFVCLDINFFWTWGVRAGIGCRYTEEYSDEFLNKIWPAMTNTIQYLAPLVVVSIGCLITAGTMISRRSHDEKVIEHQLKKYFLEVTTLRDFQIICLLLSVIFMCLTFFTLTLNFVNFLEVKRYIVLDDDEYFLFFKVTSLLETVATALYALFFSLKIFLYLGCSSTFRDTIKQGFVSLKRTIRWATNLFHKPAIILRKNEEEARARAHEIEERQEEDSTWNMDGVQLPGDPEAGHTNCSFASGIQEEGLSNQAAHSALGRNKSVSIKDQMHTKLHGTDV